MHAKYVWFLVGAVVGGCSGGGGSAPGFDITSPGTGSPNAQPLFPLQVGNLDVSLDGPGSLTIDAVIADDRGTLFRGVNSDTNDVQYYLQTDDGVFLAGDTSTGMLANPIFAVPATVKDGMAWDVHGDGGNTLHSTVAAAGAGQWQITITLSTPDGDPPSTVATNTFIEGLGVDMYRHVLIPSSVALPAPLQPHPIALDEIAGDQFNSPDAPHSMIRVGDRAVILAGITDATTGTCAGTDGTSLFQGSASSGPPIQVLDGPACVSTIDDAGDPLATGLANGAFVASDGKVYSTPYSAGGKPLRSDTTQVVQAAMAYDSFGWAPGSGAVPQLVMKGCPNGCSTTDTVSVIPYETLFQGFGTQKVMPWNEIGDIAERTPISDEDGGESWLLRDVEGIVWTTDGYFGAPQPAGRLPGWWSVQATANGHEVLRVLGDGGVDRLHVTHGVLSVEHLGEAAIPTGELLAGAFLWHDPAGDHLLAVSYSFNQGFSTGHLRRSHDAVTTGTTVALAPGLQLRETAQGPDGSTICGPAGGATPAADGWTNDGSASPALAQAGTSCALVFATSGLVAGTVPGLGTIGVAAPGGTGTTFGGTLAAEWIGALGQEMAAVPGDRFVTATDRFGPGVTLARPPTRTWIPNGASMPLPDVVKAVADIAGNGVWVATRDGKLTLVDADHEATKSTAGLVPVLGIAGGGVLAMGSDGGYVRVTPAGTATSQHAIAADRYVLGALSDGTICGSSMTDPTTLYCQPITGAERTVQAPTGITHFVALPDGTFVGNAAVHFDPAAMTATALSTPQNTGFVEIFHAADGTAWGTLGVFGGGPPEPGQIDATGFHPLTLPMVQNEPISRIRVGEHVILGADSSISPHFVRILR